MFFFLFFHDRIIFIFELSAFISLVHDIVMRVSKLKAISFIYIIYSVMIDWILAQFIVNNSLKIQL